MAAKIGLLYGSSTGNTAGVASRIADAVRAARPDGVDVHEIGAAGLAPLAAYPFLLVGIPTWNTGELQEDWKNLFEKLDGVDLSGKKVAIFGLGDQKGYADNFQDGIGILGEKFMDRGAELCGFTDAEDGTYEFTKSRGAMEGFFLGLAIDEDNQKERTDERIARWVPAVLAEFGV